MIHVASFVLVKMSHETRTVAKHILFRTKLPIIYIFTTCKRSPMFHFPTAWAVKTVIALDGK